jgi:hypothetical protein
MYEIVEAYLEYYIVSRLPFEGLGMLIKIDDDWYSTALVMENGGRPDIEADYSEVLSPLYYLFDSLATWRCAK